MSEDTCKIWKVFICLFQESALSQLQNTTIGLFRKFRLNCTLKISKLLFIVYCMNVGRSLAVMFLLFFRCGLGFVQSFRDRNCECGLWGQSWQLPTRALNHVGSWNSWTAGTKFLHCLDFYFFLLECLWDCERSVIFRLFWRNSHNLFQSSTRRRLWLLTAKSPWITDKHSNRPQNQEWPQHITDQHLTYWCWC